MRALGVVETCRTVSCSYCFETYNISFPGIKRRKHGVGGWARVSLVQLDVLGLWRPQRGRHG